MNEPLSRFLRALAPMPHFMSLAPLDAWVRLLFFPWARVGVVYLPRVVMGLFTSAIATALTLPERVLLAPVLWLAGARSRWRLRHRPGVVIVLGYPRSGTTHLHYLLSCNPRFWTPRWHHAVAPQGFFLSWSFLRVMLVPFLSNTRLMDDMAFGPEWPAEDEFAVNNWCLASSLPGRLIVPRLHGHYHRFHGLDELTPRERSRWRRYTWAFAWKLARLARSRAILLKSPSHTARVRELTDLFGAERVRYVHISRDPRAVVASNLSMLRRAQVYHLHAAPDAETIRRGLADELVATEEKYRREAVQAASGGARVSEVRYQDLVADPMGEMRRVHGELGLDWTPAVEAGLARYLHTVADYRAATPAGGGAGGASIPEPKLDALARDFGHDRPTVAVKPLPPVAPAALAPRPRAGLTLVVSAVLAVLAWVGIAHVVGDRCDWIIWPIGAAIGYVAVRAARAGSTRLGLAATAGTLFVLLAAFWPATFFSEYYPRPVRNWEWRRDVWASTWTGFWETGNVPWIVIGLLSAYRFASRKHVHPPGG